MGGELWVKSRFSTLLDQFSSKIDPKNGFPGRKKGRRPVFAKIVRRKPGFGDQVTVLVTFFFGDLTYIGTFKGLKCLYFEKLLVCIDVKTLQLSESGLKIRLSRSGAEI